MKSEYKLNNHKSNDYDGLCYKYLNRTSKNIQRKMNQLLLFKGTHSEYYEKSNLIMLMK